MFSDVPVKNKHLIQLVAESEYSVMKKDISEKLIEIINNLNGINKDSIIIDGNAHVGGLTIELGKNFNNVYAYEVNNKTCKCLKSNIKAYELNDKIKVKCKSVVKNYQKGDVIIFDPPWGGHSYKNNRKLDLWLSESLPNSNDNQNPTNIIDIMIQWKKHVKYVLLYAPYNYNINAIFNKNLDFKVYNLQSYKKKSHKLIVL